MDQAAETGGAVVLFTDSEIAADVPFFYEDVAVGKYQERIISELHAGVKACGAIEWAIVANKHILTILKMVARVGSASCSTITTVIPGNCS